MALAGKKFDAHTETEPEPGDGTVVFWASIGAPDDYQAVTFKVAEALLGTLDSFVSL